MKYKIKYEYLTNPPSGGMGGFLMITATIQGGAVQLTGNPVYISCSGGSAPVNSSEYKIMLKVISEDGKLPGAPFIDAITPDSSGEAVFDISDTLISLSMPLSSGRLAAQAIQGLPRLLTYRCRWANATSTAAICWSKPGAQLPKFFLFLCCQLPTAAAYSSLCHFRSRNKTTHAHGHPNDKRNSRKPATAANRPV